MRKPPISLQLIKQNATLADTIAYAKEQGCTMLHKAADTWHLVTPAGHTEPLSIEAQRFFGIKK